MSKALTSTGEAGNLSSMFLQFSPRCAMPRSRLTLRRIPDADGGARRRLASRRVRILLSVPRAR